MRAEILNIVREKNPVVFYITNSVTINDCANITLALGGSPLMSYCKEELREILSFSSALVINIGTMESKMCEMVVEAGKLANELNVPVILDPVGTGASASRENLVKKLISNVKFAVIKGNLAEIKTIAGIKNENNKGVDSVEEFENSSSLAKELAIELESVIAITGKEDIVSDGKRVCKIKNGTPLLRKVTGTGCMTASLIGTICGAYREDIYEGAILGVVLMGIAGEIAEKSLTSEEGSGTFRMRIIDNIFNMTEEKIRENIKINFEN